MENICCESERDDSPKDLRGMGLKVKVGYIIIIISECRHVHGTLRSAMFF